MSILVATPMYGYQCHAKHFESALCLKEEFCRAGMDHDWLTNVNDSLITRVRDCMASQFLDTEYRKLLFIDADIEFSPEDVALLWNLNAHVAVGAYRMKRPDAPLTVWKDGKLVSADEYTDPTPVDYAGTGFMMIDRAVFESMKRSVPEYEEGHVGPCWAFFQDPVEEGIHWSEDYAFCKRFRDLGGEILWHPGIDLTHWGQAAY